MMRVMFRHNPLNLKEYDMTKLEEYLEAERLHTKIWSKTVDELVSFVKRCQDKRPLDIFSDFRDNVEPYFSTFYDSVKRVAELKEQVEGD